MKHTATKRSCRLAIMDFSTVHQRHLDIFLNSCEKEFQEPQFMALLNWRGLYNRHNPYSLHLMNLVIFINMCRLKMSIIVATQLFLIETAWNLLELVCFYLFLCSTHSKCCVILVLHWRFTENG
jgi:hypothetical protein